ncbi:MAG TPA: DUF3052 domain-containing protein [Solirubrobacteraceae bacterium]|jgi:hypothetical protein
MAGYSQTPLWRKLGLREDDSLLLLDAPPDWSVPDPPEGVTRISAGRGQLPDISPAVVVAFFDALSQLRGSISELAALIFPAGAVWVAWPRRAGGHDSDIREQDIRDLALALGLVDVKVAALDEDWSGLRLVWRSERRQASAATPG